MKKFIVILSLLPLFSFTDIRLDAFRSTAALSVNMIYVTGYSPSVFDRGWVFSALGKDNITGADISDKIKWSGTYESLRKDGDKVFSVFKNFGPN